MTVAEPWIGRDRCAIVGVATTQMSKSSGRSPLGLVVEAATEAIADAGLTAADIDGIVRGDVDAIWHNDMATTIGIPNLSYWGQAGPGGSGPCAMVGQAVGAIMSGQATAVLVCRVIFSLQSSVTADKGRQASSVTEDAIITMGGFGTYDDFFGPFGALAPVSMFAMIARRHMAEFGTTQEQLGAIAMACRARAVANPKAQNRQPMTMDDYLASPTISDPLRLFDCCLRSDGAVAMVVTSADRAKDLRQPPVLISGVAQGLGPDRQGGVVFPSLMREFLVDTPGKVVADEVYRRAGMGPSDVDVAQIYDCFTISAMLQLSEYGFCTLGEAGPFAASGALELGGRLPINTSGGNLSEGMINGGTHLVEGARQIRGDSTSQVPGAEVSLVTSGPPIGTSAMLLRRG